MYKLKKKIIPPHTRHMKYTVIDFAPDNKSIMANNFLLTNLERLLRRFKSPFTSS